MQPLARAQGVEFWGALPPSGEGFIVDPDGWEGVEDGAARRGEVVQREGGGDYDLPTVLDSRIVPISGECVASSPERLRQFGQQLKGIFGGGSGVVVFDSLGSALWGVAKIAPSTQPKFKVNASTYLEARFSIQLKLDDPLLYGETRLFAGGSPAFHYGNWKAIPVHTVSGTNGSGYTINGPGGKQFKVSKPVVAGQPHVIDMATGWVTIGGVVQTGVVDIGDLWSIPGGAQVTHTVTGSGLTLSTAVRDTND